MNFKEDQHGGNTNTDRASLVYARDHWDCKTMLDIGCGTGGQVFVAQEEGYEAYGVDGTSELPRANNFQKVNYRKGISTFDIDFDLGWSVEFVEHVEESCIPIFMKEFQKCKRVILTAAPPFWGGKNHVNEQTEFYWIDIFENYGFELDKENTKKIREVSITEMNNEVRKPRQQFVKIRGLVFRRK